MAVRAVVSQSVKLIWLINLTMVKLSHLIFARVSLYKPLSPSHFFLASFILSLPFFTTPKQSDHNHQSINNGGAVQSLLPPHYASSGYHQSERIKVQNLAVNFNFDLIYFSDDQNVNFLCLRQGCGERRDIADSELEEFVNGGKVCVSSILLLLLTSTTTVIAG